MFYNLFKRFKNYCWVNLNNKRSLGQRIAKSKISGLKFLLRKDLVIVAYILKNRNLILKEQEYS